MYGLQECYDILLTFCDFRAPQQTKMLQSQHNMFEPHEDTYTFRLFGGCNKRKCPKI